MSPADLATLSLLDPDQGVCPSGHRCRLDDDPGYRHCVGCKYRGRALICWDIGPGEIDIAEQAGADANTIAWGRSFLSERAR